MKANNKMPRKGRTSYIPPKGYELKDLKFNFSDKSNYSRVNSAIVPEPGTFFVKCAGWDITSKVSTTTYSNYLIARGKIKKIYAEALLYWDLLPE